MMKRLMCLTVVAVLATATIRAEAAAIKAAVVRSQGTYLPGMTFFPDLNSGWSAFGDVPVHIDYTSLAGPNLDLARIQNTGADVLILSNPAFFTYTAEEISAVKQYVEDGHGLVISYGKFRSEDRALAPLVGLSETIVLGTGTATEPFWLSPTIPDHPLLHDVDQLYVSGVREGTTLWGSPPWSLDSGIIVAELMNNLITLRPGIVVSESGNHRGLYFSYYIENKSGGANLQDMQVFYNGILWAATPEPGSMILLLAGSVFLMKRPGAGRSD